MEKIDRLRWEAGIAIESFGVKLGIRVNTPEALELLPRYLPPQWREADALEVDHLCSIILGGTSTRKGVRRYNLLYNGPDRIARTMDTKEMLVALASALDFQVALRSPDRVFVHAGVVAVNDQAIVLPGRSRSGKSTLVKSLVEAGATYLSDEYAVFRPDGMVDPYPRPLKLRVGEDQRGWPVAIDDIGGEIGHEPLPVGCIVDAPYGPVKMFRLRRMTMPQALLSLLDNTVIARLDPPRVLSLLHRAARGARGLRGTRGEATSAVSRILPRRGSI